MCVIVGDQVTIDKEIMLSDYDDCLVVVGHGRIDGGEIFAEGGGDLLCGGEKSDELFFGGLRLQPTPVTPTAYSRSYPQANPPHRRARASQAVRGPIPSSAATETTKAFSVRSPPCTARDPRPSWLCFLDEHD